MRVVGLTGGIATGKSGVAALIRDLDVPVIDADEVARMVVAPDSPILHAIVEAFAPEVVVDPGGRLDRAAMRQRIAHDPEARAQLETLTHPAILKEIANSLIAYARQGIPTVVVEAALMVETGSYRNYPTLLVVSCSPSVQLQRLMARDQMSEEDARKLIQTQLPLKEKERVATHVIHNNHGFEELKETTLQTWSALTTSS